MDFGALPPEINSARMYSGTGSTPLLGAASAWDQLAAELHSAAGSYQSVVTRLTGTSWSGPASLSMASAVTPYVSWMSTIATQAEQTAAHARAVAGAYQTAFAATVPPQEVEANRRLLASLVTTNYFGQNSPAITGTEAHYAEMWARNAAVMYGYADASTAASTVTPFSTPPQSADQDGTASQQAAVAKATGTSQENTPTQLVSAARQALQQLSASSASSLSSETWEDLKTHLPQILKNFATTETLVQRFFSTPSNGLSALKGMVPAAPTGAAAGSAAPPGLPATSGIAGSAGLGGGGPVAELGRAGARGNLSVPPTWASAAPTTSPGASPPPVSTVSAAPDRPAGLLRGIPMTGARRRAEGFVNRYGYRNNVVPRPPAAG